MRPVPQALTVVSIVYAVMLLVVVKFRAWRPEMRRYWRSRHGRFPQFVMAGLFLIVFWAWILLNTPAPATGDPRYRGGYSPAEQKELAK